MPTAKVAPIELSCSARKRQTIIEAGTQVFLRLGYETATMDLVAAEAGVAKQTVYNHFQSKDGLFRAIVEEIGEELLSTIAESAQQGGQPRQVLTALATRFMAILLKPSSVALHRLLVSESPRFPELGQMIFTIGPQGAVDRLAAYLSEQAGKEVLAIPNPALSAEQFLGALRGHFQLRALLQVEAAPTETEIREAIEQAVNHFLKAHERRRLHSV
ncbi:MAG: TetR/AcrR family transcriptional regulator [Alphaproteobacteria bacterium]|nr:TetR/AcrR family transcriptional regulator [Alphaproteobacteria bacterium]MBU0798356.1 TetR/AcrR family transcriptional regulator [Alphaproteobacteria bacterium]MBU0887457.1 TetR/AcrR family transcriptional regulator [Alphaproteobacteria bacterium]MBU1813334.1 TetR/AcrR family transcriptional regulator [Alphaproteobacteria bacterium]